MMGKRKSDEWACGECKAINGTTRAFCENCGTMRPTTASPASAAERKCPYDGEVLRMDGYCARGIGYPLGLACPFVCQHCRGVLGWDWGCQRRCGSMTSTDRKTWTFPSDRYEFTDETGADRGDGRHWVFVAKGPRPVYRPTKAEMTALQATLARVGAEEGATP